MMSAVLCGIYQGSTGQAAIALGFVVLPFFRCQQQDYWLPHQK